MKEGIATLIINENTIFIGKKCAILNYGKKKSNFMQQGDATLNYEKENAVLMGKKT